MGAVGGVVQVSFGIFWTILAFNITKDAPFPLVHVIFPLFGVIFVLMGIASVIYNLNNATRRDRMSVVDITTDQEEPDPLNQVLGSKTIPGLAAGRVEDRLKEIDSLRDKGVITSAEYAAQRERILREI